MVCVPPAITCCTVLNSSSATHARKNLWHPAVTPCSFSPCHLSSLCNHCCADSHLVIPTGLCLLAPAYWLLPFICAEREQLTFLIHVLQTSPITRVQQTPIPFPGISSSPLDPQRVSNPNSLLAHDVPVLPDSTQPLCCLLLPRTSTQGIAFSPQGKINAKFIRQNGQCLQLPPLRKNPEYPKFKGTHKDH